MKKKFQLIGNTLVVFILLFLTNCSNSQIEADIADIELELDIRHFEQDLFENKLNTLAEFKEKYPYFFDDYTRGIIGFEGTDEEVFSQLMLFKTDVNAKKMYDFVKSKFKDFKPYRQKLTEAYKRFKYFFPEQKIPSIVTYTGNFSFYMNPVGQDYIGIALDMHMGSDFRTYDFTTIEKYWRKILIPETIVTHHMLAHSNDLFLQYNTGKNFTDEMIYQGKLLYFLDAVAPELEDHIKLGLSKAEYDWCKQEEHQIWAFLIKEKYMFETDRRRYERLLKEGPKTVAYGVPPDAPAMIGKFAGWMAVRKYMQENKEVSLKQLMTDKNAQAILQKSNYKP